MNTGDIHELAADGLLDELERLRVVEAVVTGFINQRVEFVEALRNCLGGNEDYHRWTGGAEARRQLAERLGWTVPFEYGDSTGQVASE